VRIPRCWLKALVAKKRLAGFLGVLVLPVLLVFWALFPLFCIYYSLKNHAYLGPLFLSVLGVLAWQWQHPKRNIAEVLGQPLVRLEDIASREVLSVLSLNSQQFLATAHRFPRLKELLRRLEVAVPLKVSGPALQVFRNRKVWEIAFREAVETKAKYLQLEHLFFGVLGIREMREALEQLNLKIEDIHETIKRS